MNHLFVRLGWTLVHSLWELGLVWLGFRAAMGLLQRRSARHRYFAACGALVLCVIVPWTTFIRLGLPAGNPLIQMAGDRSIALLASHEFRAGAFGNHAWTEFYSAAATASLPWFTTLWMMGCAWGALRLVADWNATRRLQGAPLRPLPEELNLRCARLAQRLGLQRIVRLGESIFVEVPSVVGWLKPSILIPVGALTGLTPVQIDAILAHELAHILRHDFPVNVLQSICEILFFHHPAVRAINERIHIERENACDDLAVAVTGDPVGFAVALAKLEGSRALRLTVAAAGKEHLLSRVRRLLGHTSVPERPYATTAWAALCGIGLYLSVFVLIPIGESHARPIDIGRSSIGFYEACPEPSAGFHPMIWTGKGAGSPLYVASSPDLTLRDIAGAAVRTARDRPILVLQFTAAGRARFKVLTRDRSSAGKSSREAIVINGTLVSAPFVRRELDVNAVTVEAGDSPGWRKELAAFMSGLPRDQRDGDFP